MDFQNLMEIEFGPDRFSRFLDTNRQEKYIYREDATSVKFSLTDIFNVEQRIVIIEMFWPCCRSNIRNNIQYTDYARKYGFNLQGEVKLF